jgi:hypothetical protein
MALRRTNGTVTIQRINGSTQQLYNVLPPGVRAAVQADKNGAVIEVPVSSAGSSQIELKAIYSIFIGGWDENNAAGTTPYHHQVGDIITFAGTGSAGIYNGTYRQVMEAPPHVGLGLDYSKLPCIRVSGEA